MTTMKSMLIRELRNGWLTPIGALQKVRCFSLAQRVSELRRDGYTVADAWVRLADGKRCKRYKVIAEPKRKP